MRVPGQLHSDGRTRTDLPRKVILFDVGFVHCSLRRLSSVHEHGSLILQLTRIGVGSNEATKGVIFTYGGVAQGQISDKPKAGVLYQLKDGIYW
jgi:hypothetical protein